MSIPKDYEKFIALLNQEEVKYLIVGAYAIAFHAQPRFTGDIDFFVAVSKRNASSLVKVLNQFGFKKARFTENDFMQIDRVIQLGYPPLRIYIVTGIDGVKFDTAWKRRIKGSFGRQSVWYISKPDLIKNKRACGRIRDKFDLELLGAIRNK